MKPTHQPTTTPAIDPAMSPAALLRGAALYLQTHGWTQHQFYDLVAHTDGPFPPACASGAIMTAATGQSSATGICSLDGDQDAETEAAIRAMRVFAAYIDLEYHACAAHYPHICNASAIDVIGDWNDHDGRTLAEVIETLIDAATDWETTHPTGGAR